MANFLMEAVILSFTIGGIVGAIGALHLTHSHSPAPVKTQEEFKRN